MYEVQLTNINLRADEDEHPSVDITWDAARRCYVARVVEYPGIEEYGRTMNKAFGRMADSYRIKQIDDAIRLHLDALNQATTV